MKKYEIPLLILGSTVLMGYVIDLTWLQGMAVSAFVMLSYWSGRGSASGL